MKKILLFKFYQIFVLIFSILILFIHCSQNSQNLKIDDIKSYAIIGFWKCQDDCAKIQIILKDIVSTDMARQVDPAILTRTRFRNIEYLGDNKWRCEQCLDLPLQLIPKDTSRLIWLEVILEMINEDSYKVADKIYNRM